MNTAIPDVWQIAWTAMSAWTAVSACGMAAGQLPADVHCHAGSAAKEGLGMAGHNSCA